MTNTKARHKEILEAAERVLETYGGVEIIDALPENERIPVIKKMTTMVVSLVNCTRNIARRNVTKAMYPARYAVMNGREEVDIGGGGARPNSGPDPWPEEERRHKVSPKLAYGSKEAYKAIAEILELPGWGHAVDLALVRMVEGDRALKVKLAEMGIILRRQN